MKYDFDKTVERRGTGALKYDALGERYGNPELLPLWVADMDFETPDFIIEAMRRRLDHPIFGYTITPDTFWQSIIDWNLTLHNWEIRKGWLRYVPGVVKAIGMIINIYSDKGEKVLIQPPVYHIFRSVIEGNGRVAEVNPLVEMPDGGYRMDLEGLERTVAKGDIKIFIMSNPHNPGGTLWSRETLAEVARICAGHGVVVVSDEIHGDMALWGNRHIPFPTVSREAASCSITLNAPSKIFNMPGVVSAYAVVPDQKIREKFYSWLDANELSEPTVFAIVATEAAYRHGATWRSEMLRYVEGNIEFLTDFLERNTPEIKAVRPQSSFLVWLDCRALGMPQKELIDLFEVKAGLALNQGEMFGREGRGFMRINVAVPRSLLETALKRLTAALQR